VSRRTLCRKRISDTCAVAFSTTKITSARKRSVSTLALLDLRFPRNERRENIRSHLTRNENRLFNIYIYIIYGPFLIGVQITNRLFVAVGFLLYILRIAERDDNKNKKRRTRNALFTNTISDIFRNTKGRTPPFFQPSTGCPRQYKHAHSGGHSIYKYTLLLFSVPIHERV